MVESEQQRIQMLPTILSHRSDLIEPIGICTGLVEASSSLWKRAAERLSVRIGDLARWAFDKQKLDIDYDCKVTGQIAIDRKFAGIDGLGDISRAYLAPLGSLTRSNFLEACTLLPFDGFLCGRGLLRRYRAWCSVCLDSMRSNTGVYELLLWRLRDVTACPIHRIELAESCHLCMAPQQDVMGRFARVGCCNYCGGWLGARDIPYGFRYAVSSEVGASSTLMSLLVWTAKFDGNAHDGRYTLQKLLQVNGVSDLLRAKLHVSLKTISHYRRRSKAPSLRMLLAIASGFNQPLHDVLVGYLHWNSEYTSANGDPKISDRTDWTAIEREFEMLVDSCMFNSLEKACEKLKISPRLVRKHLPDLVARIDSRARELKSNWAAERRQERLTVVRIAFRTLVEAGEYPSFYKLQKITGVDARLISGTFKELIDEEWLRAEATTDLKRNFHHQSRCSNNT